MTLQRRSLLVVLALTALAVVVALWATPRGQESRDNTPQQTPPADSDAPKLPSRAVRPEPVVKGLRVRVSGSPQALAQCSVLALQDKASPLVAERLKDGVFAFAGRIPAGASLVAFAHLGHRDLSGPGRDIPNVHVSQFVKLPSEPQDDVSLELKPTECLTIHARDAQGHPVLDATASVDFSDETPAMNWLTLMELAGFRSLDGWLQGTDKDAPQVPLLRRGSRVRLSAQSKGRFGASPWLVVEQSGNIEITLGEAKSFVEIEACDPQDRPVPRLALAFAIRRISDGVHLRAGPVITDDAGRCRVHFHEEGVQLEVSLTSDQWYLPERVAIFGVESSLKRLTVRPAIAISIEIRFEDNQAYAGPLVVQSSPVGTFMSAFSAPGVPLGINGPAGAKSEQNPQGIYKIEGVPGDLDLSCHASPNRAGYGELIHTIFAAALKPNAHYVLTIPKASPKRASAKLVFTGDWEKLGKSSVQVVRLAPYFSSSCFVLRFSKETNLLYPGEYKVILFGGAWGWESETFVLEAGEERKVELPCVAAASVTATIRDESGRGLHGAALCHGLARWADFPASPQPGWLAVSDAGGKATLQGCPAGQVELRLEADGYEPETVKVVLAPETNNDIGVIVLRPARGEIRIRIKNFERIARLEPQIDLVVAGGKGGGRRGPHFLDSPEVVFSGLPLGRTYSSAIGPRVGRSWKMLNGLQPTESEPALTIEVDAETFDFRK